MKLDKAGSIGILFCAGTAALSHFIMWGLSEPSSHLAIDIPDSETILHSGPGGVHTSKRPDFMASHSIVDTFRLRLAGYDQMVIEKKLLSYGNVSTAGYDYGAFASLALSGLKAKLFGEALPLKSRWQEDDKFLCTEMCYILNQFVVEQTGKSIFNYDQDMGALSPWMVRQQLVKAYGSLREINLLRPSANSPAAV